jgi:hypothetical protein
MVWAPSLTRSYPALTPMFAVRQRPLSVLRAHPPPRRGRSTGSPARQAIQAQFSPSPDTGLYILCCYPEDGQSGLPVLPQIPLASMSPTLPRRIPGGFKRLVGIHSILLRGLFPQSSVPEYLWLSCPDFGLPQLLGGSSSATLLRGLLNVHSRCSLLTCGPPKGDFTPVELKSSCHLHGFQGYYRPDQLPGGHLSPLGTSTFSRRTSNVFSWKLYENPYSSRSRHYLFSAN